MIVVLSIIIVMGFIQQTVILDTSGRRFGGYSTQSWGQSSVGSNYARAVGSFIFSLSNKVKYDLSDPINYQAV